MDVHHQTLLERRKGGETGVAWVEALQVRALQQAHHNPTVYHAFC